MECACSRPVVSYLDMAFCASCGGALRRDQKFTHSVSGHYTKICNGCGAMCSPDERMMDLHLQVHADSRLWMESLMLRLGELHGFLLSQQIDKAAIRCQELLDSFPKELT